MTDQEITQEQFEQLIEDGTYLQDEAEALQYVIDSIPYSEAPPGDQSVAEKLLLLDYSQVHYFRPVFERAFSNSRTPTVDDFSRFKETFDTGEVKSTDIHNILNKLAKHRAALINIFRNISLIDWEKRIYRNNLKLSLFEFASEMITVDRKILKEIADMVLVLRNNQGERRAIGKQQHNPNNRD